MVKRRGGGYNGGLGPYDDWLSFTIAGSVISCIDKRRKTMKQDLIKAIEQKRMVEFLYNGKKRIGEPHVYGLINNNELLLLYQTSGSSSTTQARLPEWRRLKVDKIINLKVLEEKFPGPRKQGISRYNDWDVTHAVVE